MQKLKEKTFYLNKWDLIWEKRAELQKQINKIKAKWEFVQKWVYNKNRHSVIQILWEQFSDKWEQKKWHEIENKSSFEIAWKWRRYMYKIDKSLEERLK